MFHSSKKLQQQLDALRRPTGKMILTNSDVGSLPVTKLFGEPWWPDGVSRPRCKWDHDMVFVAQIRLDQVPALQTESALLSFHYCFDCGKEGRLGWGGEFQSRAGHDVRVFANPEIINPDHRGILTDERLPEYAVALEDALDYPNIQDIWRLFPRTDKPGKLRNITTTNYHRSKLGGWPCWTQWCEWPEDDVGEPMLFAAQIDGVIGNWSLGPWCNGLAYLFVSSPDEDEHQQAELVIQET